MFEGDQMKYREPRPLLFCSVFIFWLQVIKTAQIVHGKNWFIVKMLPLFHAIQGQKVKLKGAKLENKVVIFAKKQCFLYTLFLSACWWLFALSVTSLWPLTSGTHYWLPMVSGEEGKERRGEGGKERGRERDNKSLWVRACPGPLCCDNGVRSCIKLVCEWNRQW